MVAVIAVAEMFGISGRRDELTARLERFERWAAGEPGCRRYAFAATLADPSRSVLVSDYAPSEHEVQTVNRGGATEVQLLSDRDEVGELREGDGRGQARHGGEANGGRLQRQDDRPIEHRGSGIGRAQAHDLSSS